MERRCVNGTPHDPHWRNVQADVVAVASQLIPAVNVTDVTIGELRYLVRDFHSCHVMALLIQLACEMKERGHSPDTVRDQLLAWDIASAFE